MLRKSLIFVFLGCILSTQYSFGQRFSMGIIGGATSSQISGDGIYGFAQFGFLAGADVNYEISEDWSASLGLQFNQKGARNYQSETVYSAYRLRANYIESPLNIYYQLYDFQFSTGLYLGVITNHKERNSFGPVDPVRNFKPLDFGFQLGVNYSLNENWQVELRFQNSLIPVRDHLVNQTYPPNLFVLGDWHQKILDLGQYFTSLSLILRYSI